MKLVGITEILLRTGMKDSELFLLVQDHILPHPFRYKGVWLWAQEEPRDYAESSKAERGPGGAGNGEGPERPGGGSGENSTQRSGKRWFLRGGHLVEAPRSAALQSGSEVSGRGGGVEDNQDVVGDEFDPGIEGGSTAAFDGTDLGYVLGCGSCPAEFHEVLCTEWRR